MVNLNKLVYVLSVSAVIAAGASQTRIGTIRDRPLTWDWAGIVPLGTTQQPSAEQIRMFAVMRSGDYYLADSPTRSHFEKHPDDLVDAWIIFQCAKNRGQAEELVADSARWVRQKPTTATRYLRVRALNLAFLARRAKDKSHDPMNALRKEIRLAEARLQSDAETNIAALTAVLGSLDSDVKRGRDLAKKFGEGKQASPEATFLYVRSLLKGTFGVVAAVADPSGRMVPVPQPARMQLLPPTEPRMDDALAELSRAEKRYGKHPLISYFRAQAYAMKAYFSAGAQGDEAKFEAAAISQSRQFLGNSEDYPRLASIAKKYLESKRFTAFLPWPDE